MASIIKANKFQDFAGNDILSSDGAGVITPNASGIKNTPAFLVNLNSNQSIANTTETLVQFTDVIYDTDSAYDTSTYKFTVPSGEGGKYEFTTSVRKNNWSSTRFFARLYVNTTSGTNAVGESGAANTGAYASSILTYTFNLSAGDTVEIYMYNKGGNASGNAFVSDGSHYFGYRLA